MDSLMAAYPPSQHQDYGAVFCARPTNHKQSLIINSPCSFSVHDSREQLAAARDPAPAGVSTTHTTDSKRRESQW